MVNVCKAPREDNPVGRRNHYTLDREHAMRHTAQGGYEIGALLEALPRNAHPDGAET